MPFCSGTNKKETVTFRTRSTLTERSNKNRMVGGSSPSKTVEILSANTRENMRLRLLKKNNKTREKTSVAIGVDLGRLCGPV